MAATALFLDRDGTLIVHRPYLSRPEQVELLPGVRETLQAARKDGCMLFLFSNQSGVGRGYFTIEDVYRCNLRMLDLLGLPDGVFSGVCIAPEHPDEPSLYRKPSPRFIVEMMGKYGLQQQRTWMIGDARTDVEAGLSAEVRTVLVDSDTPIGELPTSVWRCRDLNEFYRRMKAE